MQDFIKRYEDVLSGVLSGFDRVLFRGSLRNLSYVDGLFKFLNWRRIKLVNFGVFFEGVTKEVELASARLAASMGCPFQYIASPKVSKDDIARRHAATTGTHGPLGLVCVLRCVEPCQSFELRRNAQTRRLEPQSTLRKCLHYYFYFQHPELGWMHIRIQSWLPLMIRVYMNGREWLGRQMTKAGIDFVQQDNCFVHIADFAEAQRLADLQLRTAWEPLLNELLAVVHPVQSQLYPDGWPYYWTADQTEWATDVLFKTSADLQKCYPHFLRHSAFDVSCADVLRFLGRKLKPNGEIKAGFAGDVQSTLRTRPEGTRIKHQLNENWVKMYDKREIILRTETTINNPAEFKTYRTSERDPEGELSWRPMRKGVADLHRRAQVSQAANERYLQSLASAQTPELLATTVAPVCQRSRWHNRSVRALNPLGDEDARLLEAVSQGQFAINGFRNADVRQILFSPLVTDNPKTIKAQAAAVTRKLQLLRAHSLIKKVPNTHRYTLSKQGATIITALLAARRTSVANLTQMVA
jgi:hypothetical protein